MKRDNPLGLLEDKGSCASCSKEGDIFLYERRFHCRRCVQRELDNTAAAAKYKAEDWGNWIRLQTR